MTWAFPIRWSFAFNGEVIRFFRSDTKQTWIRVQYNVTDAQSLIDYLNTRT